RLKPSLAQFLIYGPVPGTPFYERIIKDNLLHDVYTANPELMYRRADGFTTVIKHPTLSPEQIEDIQRWCFDQDFQRLGPSIFRVLESRLLGYQKLKNSANPFLRQKARHYAAELRTAYPVFLAGRALGPNRAIRRWIGDLEKKIHTELGKPKVAEQIKAVVAVGAALWTGLTLKLNLFQHPKLSRTAYRMPEERWAGFDSWEGIQRKLSIPELLIQVELQHARQQVWMRLEGALSAADADRLAQRLGELLEHTRNRLVLDLKKLHWEKVEDLKPLREKLASYKSRIRLVLPKLAAAHPELMLVAAAFHHYNG